MTSNSPREPGRTLSVRAKSESLLEQILGRLGEGMLSPLFDRPIRWLEAVEYHLLQDPAFINVFVRWLTWLMAAIIIVSRAAPKENLANTAWLLPATGLWLLAVTLYGPLVRRNLSDTPLVRFLDMGAITSAADIMLSCSIVYLTGGWASPFYEFALTSVIAPSLRFRLKGALISSTAYCILYVWAVAASRGGRGLDGITINGVIDGGFFSAVINSFMVSIFCAYLADVMRRLNTAVVEANEARRQARELAAQEERSRLAREIHDGIAQRIFMLTLNLEACAELSQRADVRGRPPGDLHRRLEDLLRMSREALWEVRHYIFDLKPHLAGEKGLSNTLSNQVREFEAISGLKVELTVSGASDLEPDVPVATSTALIRIVQEGLANVYKHAMARHVGVTVDYGEETIEVEILDDGRGFDCQSQARGLGLDGMQHRATEVGGSFQVQSVPEVGTRIMASLPRRERSRKKRGAR